MSLSLQVSLSRPRQKGDWQRSLKQAIDSSDHSNLTHMTTITRYSFKIFKMEAKYSVNVAAESVRWP